MLSVCNPQRDDKQWKDSKERSEALERASTLHGGEGRDAVIVE
jgi:hypothetical protein